MPGLDYLKKVAIKIFNGKRELTIKEFNQQAAMRARATKDESRMLKRDLTHFKIIDAFGQSKSKLALSPSLNTTQRKTNILDFSK